MSQKSPVLNTQGMLTLYSTGLVIYNPESYTPIETLIVYRPTQPQSLLFAVRQTEKCTCPERHDNKTLHYTIPRQQVAESMARPDDLVGDGFATTMVSDGFFRFWAKSDDGMATVAVDANNLRHLLDESYELVPPDVEVFDVDALVEEILDQDGQAGS